MKVVFASPRDATTQHGAKRVKKEKTFRKLIVLFERVILINYSTSGRDRA